MIIISLLSDRLLSDDDDDEIAYFTVRWKTRASFVYRTKNVR